MALWRLHLKTAAQNRNNSIAYCINNNLAAIGWRVSSIPQTKFQYEELCLSEHKKRVSSCLFVKEIEIGDLIWIRDTQGLYYIGKISSDWIYKTDDASILHDFPNQRNCIWKKIGNSSFVPGRIIAAFRSGKALNRIRDNDIENLSEWLFNNSHTPKEKHLKTLSEKDINLLFKLVSDKDCEDIIASYLQVKKDYIIIPSSCEKHSQAYEFILINKVTGKQASVQVKQGSTDINANDLKNTADKIYLFTTEGCILNDLNNMEIISKKSLTDFYNENMHLLTPKIKFWLSYLHYKSV